MELLLSGAALAAVVVRPWKGKECERGEGKEGGEGTGRGNGKGEGKNEGRDEEGGGRMRVG